MTMHVCSESGCPVLSANPGRCERHARERDRARGTRQQRGYDGRHDQLRAQWQRRLDSGEVVHCWRCLTLGRRTVIDPTRWHLGHDDEDRSQYRGPECVPCNTATAGRLSHL